MSWDISAHAAYEGGLATRVAELRPAFSRRARDVRCQPVFAGPELICRSGPEDGIQLFRAFDSEGFDDTAQRVAINLALGAAYKADRDSRRALGFRRDDLSAHSRRGERH